jgi:methionine-rich copper-binding protein CopC
MDIKHLFLAAAVAAGSMLTAPAWAHAKLVAAEPPAAAVLSAAPATIRLQFNDNVELPFSKVKLVNAKDAVIEALAIVPDKNEPKALIATLPPVPAGAYRVVWSTVTRDGHKVKGEYAFSVK